MTSASGLCTHKTCYNGSKSLVNSCSWKAAEGYFRTHVFQDLRPYVCVWPLCTKPEEQYESRHALSKHLTIAGTIASLCFCSSSKQFRCPRFLFGAWCVPCASKPRSKFNKQDESDVYTPIIRPTGTQCPFCQEFIPTLLREKSGRRMYFRHIGRHMEEISLSSMLWQEHRLDCDTASATSSMLDSFKYSTRMM